MRTPRQIIGDDAFEQLVFEGYAVVPVTLSGKPLEAARDAMPVEQTVWLENGRLHSKLKTERECVDPASVWRAILDQLDRDIL